MRVAFAAILIALTTLAVAPSAFAAPAATWNIQEDYYSWGSRAGDNDGAILAHLGDNPTNPGVHGNYTTTTNKCRICHAVHRANYGGIKLLRVKVATCAGCHRAGASTVTHVNVTWEDGGPHNSGSDATCNGVGCHLPNPHGAGGSQYKIFAAKLINNVQDPEGDGAKADLSVAAAVADPGASGITLADLNAELSSTWGIKDRRTVVIGYTCNSGGCHEQTMLSVVRKGYSELRTTTYPDGPKVAKTGHMSSAVADPVHGSYTGVETCTSCHDQTDDSTHSGFTFPHSQTAYGTTNLQGGPRAFLWMGYAGSKGATLTAMGPDDKALDGACLKCHRDTGSVAGIGIDM